MTYHAVIIGEDGGAIAQVNRPTEKAALTWARRYLPRRSRGRGSKRHARKVRVDMPEEEFIRDFTFGEERQEDGSLTIWLRTQPFEDVGITIKEVP